MKIKHNGRAITTQSERKNEINFFRPFLPTVFHSLVRLFPSDLVSLCSAVEESAVEVPHPPLHPLCTRAVPRQSELVPPTPWCPMASRPAGFTSYDCTTVAVSWLGSPTPLSSSIDSLPPSTRPVCTAVESASVGQSAGKCLVPWLTPPGSALIVFRSRPVASNLPRSIAAPPWPLQTMPAPPCPPPFLHSVLRGRPVTRLLCRHRWSPFCSPRQYLLLRHPRSGHSALPHNPPHGWLRFCQISLLNSSDISLFLPQFN